MKKLTVLLLALAAVFSIENKELHSDSFLIAVYSFKAQGISKSKADMITDWIATGISNSQYKLVERSRLNTVMKEMQLQMSGLTNESTAVKVGKMVSANKILTGTLTKLGRKYVLSGRVIDVEKGLSQFGHSEYTWRFDELDVCTQRFVDNMIKKMSGSFVAQNKALIQAPKVISSKELEKDRIMKTIHTLYDAYVNRDLDAYISVLDSNARIWCSAYNIKGINKIRNFRKNITFKRYTNFDYRLKNIKIIVAGNYANVYDTYMLQFTIKKTGRRFKESARERFKLVKKGNSWYILENQEY